MRETDKKDAGKELYTLADTLAFTFSLPGAEPDRRRLQTLAWAHWQRVKVQPRVVWLTYLLRLSLTCPPLLDGPPGFEWIPQALRWELYYRKANRSADRDFWIAVSQVRAAVRQGRPSNKARDYLRHQRVVALMKDEGLNQTQAVNRLVELREGSGDARAIWRSLAQVKKELTRHRALLLPALHEPRPPKTATGQSLRKLRPKKKR